MQLRDMRKSEVLLGIRGITITPQNFSPVIEEITWHRAHRTNDKKGTPAMY
jgi:hypothetical protein